MAGSRAQAYVLLTLVTSLALSLPCHIIINMLAPVSKVPMFMDILVKCLLWLGTVLDGKPLFVEIIFIYVSILKSVCPWIKKQRLWTKFSLKAIAISVSSLLSLIARPASYMFLGPPLLGSPVEPVPGPGVVSGPGVADEERWQARKMVAPPLRLDIVVPWWLSAGCPLDWNTPLAASPLAAQQGTLQELL